MAPCNLSESEKEFVRTYTRKLLVMSTLATAVFLGILVPAYTGQLDLGLSMVPLGTTQERLVFTLKHLALQLAWIIISMYYVIYHRLGTPALDPTKGYESLVQNAKNILTNSVEHGLVFTFSLLIAATDLTPELCRRLVPTLNLLYILGRLLYLIGYPCNRSFGFTILNFTIITTVSYNLYQLACLYV
ncbi:hypothetical protein TYRP_001825 [Tyrophagus putrescentiae]|nr:hypothetical protein TYRP_001825 [Tyrophagus putrescentiae]